MRSRVHTGADPAKPAAAGAATPANVPTGAGTPIPTGVTTTEVTKTGITPTTAAATRTAGTSGTGSTAEPAATGAAMAETGADDQEAHPDMPAAGPAISGETGLSGTGVTATDDSITTSSKGDFSGDTHSGPAPDRDSRHSQEPVRAGEIDDNEMWQEYLDYVSRYEGRPVRETRLDERYLITVLDSARNPVRGAHVTIHDEETGVAATARTHADGRTLHHPQEPGEDGQLNITVLHQDLTRTVAVERSEYGRDVELQLLGTPESRSTVPLDVLFLLDATGSMADEINRIKETLVSIGRQIADLPQNPDLRTAMVAYRDRDDAYITRVFDFDPDIRRFVRTVRNIEAEGGGDYPESLNQALHEALTDTSWRTGSVKLVFLLADAPPHLDYPQDESYVREMARAQEEGIKIFAVASSGLDNQGEYIFRQLAQQTLGRFVFILYESPPQGELTTPHDVGDDFSVENLDRLIVRLITEELDALTPAGN